MDQLSRSLAVLRNQLLQIQPFHLAVDHSPASCNHDPIRTVCAAEQQRR